MPEKHPFPLTATRLRRAIESQRAAERQLTVFGRVAGEPAQFEGTPLPASNWEAARKSQRRMARLEEDLAVLLTTRPIVDAVPDEYPEVQSSLLTLGLPRSSPRESVHRETLAARVKRAVESGEPRLTDITVTVGDDSPVFGTTTATMSARVRDSGDWVEAHVVLDGSSIELMEP